MNIEKFKKDFRNKINNYSRPWGREERILHLVEEIGEFAEIALQYNGSKEPKKDINDVKIALSDILEAVFSLSLLYGIDIDVLLRELTDEEDN